MLFGCLFFWSPSVLYTPKSQICPLGEVIWLAEGAKFTFGSHFPSKRGKTGPLQKGQKVGRKRGRCQTYKHYITLHSIHIYTYTHTSVHTYTYVYGLQWHARVSRLARAHTEQETHTQSAHTYIQKQPHIEAHARTHTHIRAYMHPPLTTVFLWGFAPMHPPPQIPSETNDLARLKSMQS